MSLWLEQLIMMVIPFAPLTRSIILVTALILSKNLTEGYDDSKIQLSGANGTGGFSNCKDLLGDTVQLQWDRDGDDFIKFKLSGKMTEKQWVALGFSRLLGSTRMVAADAIVVYFTPFDKEKFHADDYFITAKSQCDGNYGVCPDKRVGGANDVQVLQGARNNGVTTVMFRRPIKTREIFDLSLEDDQVNIFVAIGNLNGRNEANYHFAERTGEQEDIRINPTGKGDHSCFKLVDGITERPPRLKPWLPVIIEGVTNFTARIGPSGGMRGYTAITGREETFRAGYPPTSSGICWYLNDLLIPQIYVERGETYYFWVEGGDDSHNPTKYHPFYITDSPEGGYGQKSEPEQVQQRAYAGIGFDTAGYPYPTSAGRYCEWEHKTVDKSASSETFESYFKTLRLSCEDGRRSLLTWTVQMDAPEILYYQCYTHKNMGWKIRVVDKREKRRRNKIIVNSWASSSPTAKKSLLVASLLVFIVSVRFG